MRLSTLTRQQGANLALRDGSVTVDGFDLNFVDEPVLVNGFRRMVRNLEFDVAEMAVTTYLTAREHGVAFTALPIFLVRDFHHAASQVLRENASRPIPAMAGGRVGVNRGYTVTTGVWGRAALAQSGLDLDAVTWMRSGDEHVTSYTPPANVTNTAPGTTLEDLLLGGELDAVVGANLSHEGVTSQIADPDDAAAETLRVSGVFPINHLIVVRNELLSEQPTLAPALFEAFAAAKQTYLKRLRVSPDDTRQDRVLTRVMQITGDDPLPYGVEASRPTLDALLGHARSQHIIRTYPSVDDLFEPSTLRMQG